MRLMQKPQAPMRPQRSEQEKQWQPCSVFSPSAEFTCLWAYSFKYFSSSSRVSASVLCSGARATRLHCLCTACEERWVATTRRTLLGLLPPATALQRASCFAILRFDARGVVLAFILDGAISHHPPCIPNFVPHRPTGSSTSWPFGVEWGHVMRSGW